MTIPVHEFGLGLIRAASELPHQHLLVAGDPPDLPQCLDLTMMAREYEAEVSWSGARPGETWTSTVGMAILATLETFLDREDDPDEYDRLHRLMAELSLDRLSPESVAQLRTLAAAAADCLSRHGAVRVFCDSHFDRCSDQDAASGLQLTEILGSRCFCVLWGGDESISRIKRLGFEERFAIVRSPADTIEQI